MTTQKMRRRVLLPLGVLLLFTAAIGLLGIYSQQKQSLVGEAERRTRSVQSSYRTFLRKDAETFMGFCAFLTRDAALLDAWRSGDPDRTLALANPLYVDLRTKYRVTHFYLLQPDGTVFLRAHTPERRGDVIRRHTLAKAQRSGRPAWGVELGPLGTCTLRVVQPVVRDGKVQGYLELGEEIGHITTALEKTLGLDLALLIEKRWLKESDWREGEKILGAPNVPWNALPGYVVAGLTRQELLKTLSTLPLKEGFSASDVFDAEHNGQILRISSFPLDDAGGIEVGRMLVIEDATGDWTILYQVVFAAGAAVCALSLGLLLFLYSRIGKEEADLAQTHLREIVEHDRLRMAEQQQFIAEISQAHDKIGEQTRFLQLILDTIPVPVSYKDDQQRYLNCNIAFERFFGVCRGDVAGKRVEDLFPQDLDVHRQANAALLTDRENLSYEATMRNASGEPREVLVCKARFASEADGTGIVAVVLDLTEQRRAERERRKTEQHLETIFENARVGIVSVNDEGYVTRANQAFCGMLGYSEQELLKRHVLELTHPDDLEKTRQEWDNILSGRSQVMDYSKRYLRKDGTSVEVFVSSKWVRDATDNRPYLIAVVEDVTDRLRAEESRDLLANAVESAEESILVTDAAGTILYVNPAFERLTGYASDEALGRTPAILKSGSHPREFYEGMWAALASKGLWRGRLVNRGKSGELFEVVTTLSAVRDAHGRVQHYVAVQRDVTREAELEANLRQAQKMEAVGTLASGISHNINNIFHIIGGCAHLLVQKGGLKEEERQYVARILKSVDRGGDLVKKILTFSRMGATELAPVDLNREVAELVAFLAETSPKNIRFETRLSAGLPPLLGEPGQMQQIVMNLATNACDAMPEGGVVTFRTLRTPWSPERFRDFPEARQCDYVELVVSDTGVGMDPATVERMYDPFFTTKETGKGTGLGLATVYGIVKGHDGYIQCRTAPGQGTSFHMLFPAAEERRKAPRAEVREPQEIVGGMETLLLVDDDSSILETTAELLASFGYSILKASSGEEAVEIFSRRRDIAAVVLDLGMPGMGGKKCLAELLRLNPEARVIVASGYDAADDILNAPAPTARDFLRKPFRLADLTRKLRALLDPRDTSAMPSGSSAAGKSEA